MNTSIDALASKATFCTTVLNTNTWQAFDERATRNPMDCSADTYRVLDQFTEVAKLRAESDYFAHPVPYIQRMTESPTSVPDD
jgi:hypothetical protein